MQLINSIDFYKIEDGMTEGNGIPWISRVTYSSCTMDGENRRCHHMT